MTPVGGERSRPRGDFHRRTADPAARLARRWSTRTDFSLAGLVPFLAAAVALAVGIPRAAYVPTWPVLIGSPGWVAAVGFGTARMAWSVDLGTLLGAAPHVVLLLPFLPGVFMSDGLKSVAILAAVWGMLMLAVLPLPAIDAAVARLRGVAPRATSQSMRPSDI